MLESLLHNVAAFQPVTLLKKTLRHRFFSCEFCKNFKNINFTRLLDFPLFQERFNILHISLRRIPQSNIPKKIFKDIFFVMPSSKRTKMKINKLKVWKNMEKCVGQRYISRSQDKFYLKYNFCNLNHLQKHSPGSVLSKSCY